MGNKKILVSTLSKEEILIFTDKIRAEIEALETTVRNLENESCQRNNPDINYNLTDFYVDNYEFIKKIY